jgi:hypothetical protein
LENYRAAIRDKDVGAFVEPYDERVRVFDMWRRWSSDGVATDPHARLIRVGTVGRSVILPPQPAA